MRYLKGLQMAKAKIPKIVSDYIDEYFSNGTFNASISGAESAWRGFELQTLYVCLRMLEDKSGNLTYMPETVEDLLIIDSTAASASIELVQVKSSNSINGLSLSAIIPKKNGKKLPDEDSFFGHVRFFLERDFDVSMKLVVFGKLGNELHGYSNNDTKYRESVLEKIKKQYGEDVEACARKSFVVEAVSEEQTRARVNKAIKSFLEVAARPEMLINAINARVRYASRFREAITLEDLRRMVQDVGEDIVSFSGYESQYGRTLFSLAKRFSNQLPSSELAAYQQGISATPEHIASGFDVIRSRWMDSISDAFLNNDIVLVAGASGQGKSTLCYRFLYERTSVFDGYLISGLHTQEEARDVCACLLRIAERSDGALTYVYIDGAEEVPWIWMAEQISERSCGKIKLLVSIREESMNWFNGVVKHFDYLVINIGLSRDEAEEIYASYKNAAFPSFKESWLSFGERGPLMEYIASLSSGTSLQSRLSEQVSAFCQNAPSDSWVYALYLVSLLGSEGISVETAELKEVSSCDNIIGFIETLQNEHFVKVFENGTIAPIHPYRSKILVGLLDDVILEKQDKIKADVVRCASRRAATVLVHTCIDFKDVAGQAYALVPAAHESWDALAEIIKYALWADTRNLYIDCAQIRTPFIERGLCSWLVFAAGGGISGTFGATDNGFLSDLMAKSMGNEGRELFTLAAECNVDYAATRSFLHQIDFAVLPVPGDSAALTSAGFVLTQLAVQGISMNKASSYAAKFVSLLDVETAPLESLLDFVMGASMCGCVIKKDVLDTLMNRINCECGVVWSSIDNGSVNLLQVPEGSSQDLNDELVAALAMYRKLLPGAETYAGRQIGLDAFLHTENLPLFSKCIPAKNLPIYWCNVPDRMFISMCNVDDSPDSWDELANYLREIFSLFLEVADGLSRAIDKCFEKGLFVTIKKSLVEKINKLAERTAFARVSVPKEMLDCTGFCEFGSPVDPRQTRKADEKAVPGNSHEDGMLKVTFRVVNAISNFTKFYAGPLFKFKDGESAKTTSDIRFAIFNLAEIVNGCNGAQMELGSLYSSRIVPENTNEEAALLCCLYNKCLVGDLKAEQGVRYSQKQRARRILHGDELLRDAMVKRGFKVKSLAVGYSLSFFAEFTESFEEAYRSEAINIFGSFGSDDALVEYFLLPKVLGEVSVDYLFGGYYFGSVSYPSFQLLGLHGDDRSVLASPKRNLARAEQLGIGISSVLEAYSAAKSLSVLCSQCAEVNSAILKVAGDSELSGNVGYVEWRKSISSSLEDASSILKQHIGFIFSKIGESCDELVSSIDDVVRQVPSIADASNISEILDELMSMLITLDPAEFVFDENDSVASNC